MNHQAAAAADFPQWLEIIFFRMTHRLRANAQDRSHIPTARTFDHLKAKLDMILHQLAFLPVEIAGTERLQPKVLGQFVHSYNRVGSIDPVNAPAIET